MSSCGVNLDNAIAEVSIFVKISLSGTFFMTKANLHTQSIFYVSRNLDTSKFLTRVKFPQYKCIVLYILSRFSKIHIHTLCVCWFYVLEHTHVSWCWCVLVSC
jgi:hypothetical protein